ncbi:TNF receptor-associated factor 3 [Gadus chalcogrammus]|uniref:TNF receptor-associated factor 3 n=1 Tax=Gadus chalcogrammus TaxID=1042646 RepID=UPI0024C46096|nr:TNF receptor-associated factor 3 [Gadus chalcogrammus]
MSAGGSPGGREIQIPLQQGATASSLANAMPLSLVPPGVSLRQANARSHVEAPPEHGSGGSHGPDCGFLPVQGGFRDRFLATPEPKYCCEACRLVLCQPRQTECGHRFCDSCINELLSHPKPMCPVDMEPLFKEKVFRDVCCHREIMALNVLCRSHSNGCAEHMTLQQVPDHLNVCPFFEVPCPLGKCKERVMRKDISDHLGFKCKHRESSCEYCKHKMPLSELQKHKETVCPAFPVACPNNCSHSPLLRNKLSSHQQECPKSQALCPFQRYGCTQKGSNQDIRDHEAESAADHLRMMLSRSCALETKVEDVREELLERSKVLPGLSSRLAEMEKLTEELRDKNRLTDQKIVNMQKLMSSQSEKLLEVELELRVLRLLREEVGELRGALENLRAGLALLEQGARGPAATGSMETQLSRHDDMLSVHEIRLADMDLRFQVLETASFNGTLIWKIREYKRRKQDAVASKTSSLYSQPFYTGYFGYKMCARVYLNGDGMGKGTHLSLFFVVMRGEYDALLPWPFKQKVTLMLMDQGPPRKHLGDAFKPDPNSSSFRRPVAEMNIASGCPLFVAQTVLDTGTYIKDDTIFIKVTVDTSDLPDP